MQRALSRRGLWMAILVAIALGALLAIALMSPTTRMARAAQHHTARHVAKAHIHKGSHREHKASTDPAVPDPDNVQSGTQSTPDTPSETSHTSEASGESTSSSEDQLQPGEPTGGHQDAGPNVDHQCQDCAGG